MNITYYGHSCFLIETNGKKILFDPFISGNELASEIIIDDIPADYILLSHGHADHVADAERIAKNTGATIISNFEIITWFENKGIEGHPLNHGGKYDFDFGTVKYVNAIHSSSMPDGSYGGNPGGFVIWNDEGSFYFSGDTALTMDMKLIPLTCPPLDFAILPIGDNFTMGIEEANLAADFIETKKIIACHYDTFGIIAVDKQKAKKIICTDGDELIFMNIGECRNIKLK